ncbi:MAG: glutamyl-tRNA reductase [Dehalococcoidia bacterium]|nr:glutamyl-tRNA reductase [Dehalococcoidia bacterium]
MHINLLGINYQTAPIDIRDKAAINVERLADALASLRKHVAHGIILSTCNRTEIYASGNNISDISKASEEFCKDYLHIPTDRLSPFMYSIHDEALVNHIFRVASGIESMIIGEYEVLGQVNQALDAAEKSGMVNLPLRQVFQYAVRTGRKVREETGISKYALSVSSVAVNKALDIIHNKKTSKLVIIGAGEAGKQAIKVARSRGLKDIVIMSRTVERAVHLAKQYGGRPAGTAELTYELHDAVIVITCAAAPHSILRHQHVAEAMSARHKLPMIIIDIAMPRNVEPNVKEINNVHLFNIDDLNELANKNRAQREIEIATVEKIISQETDIFMKWWHTYSVRPAVKALMSKAEKIRSSQYNKTIKKLGYLADSDKQALNRLTTSIVDKILREPILYLKSSEDGNDITERAELIKKLFNLDSARDHE